MICARVIIVMLITFAKKNSITSWKKFCDHVINLPDFLKQNWKYIFENRTLTSHFWLLYTFSKMIDFAKKWLLGILSKLVEKWKCALCEFKCIKHVLSFCSKYKVLPKLRDRQFITWHFFGWPYMDCVTSTNKYI